MMNKATFNTIFLSFLGLSIGTLGGMCITWKLAGVENGHHFLKFALITQSAIFLFQLIFFPRARKELRFQLLYLASFGLTMVWVMVSLILPVFWMENISIFTKWILVGVLIFTGISNYRYGSNYIHREWEKCGASEFERLYKPFKNTIDWDRVIRAMKVTFDLHVPLIPQNWSIWMSVCLVASSLLGLNLRNVFPVFSIFAFGIPSAVTAAMFLQMSGYYIAQASKVKAIEEERGIKIRSTE